MTVETITVTVPPDGGTSQRWGEWLPLRAPPKKVVELDLAEVTFVDPLFVCRLRGFMDWHCANGNTITVVPPHSPAVRRYLAQMNLVEDLPGRCTCDLGVAAPSSRGDVLIPVKRLASPQDVRVLDDELAELFYAHFKGPLGKVADPFARTVGEMCDNATTHGKSKVGVAYIAAQRYAGGRCVLVVGDLGVGIPERMREAFPHLVNDDDAIREATKEGVTSTAKTNRGIGYQFVIDGLKENKVPFAELRVWSGRGRFRVESREGRQIRRRAWGVDRGTAGTWVRLELSASG